MSEEIQDASVVVPRAIMFSIFINGSLAFGILIVTLFSLNNVQRALNTPTGYPYMEIFLQSTGSIAAATILASILVVMQFCANVGLLASASRMCWSFARDRGLPGWAWLQHVSVPIYPSYHRGHCLYVQSASRSTHALLFPSGPSSSPHVFHVYSHSSSSDHQPPSTI